MADSDLASIWPWAAMTDDGGGCVQGRGCRRDDVERVGRYPGTLVDIAGCQAARSLCVVKVAGLSCSAKKPSGE